MIIPRRWVRNPRASQLCIRPATVLLTLMCFGALASCQHSDPLAFEPVLDYFPPPADCPECRNPNSQESSDLADAISDIGDACWHLAATLENTTILIGSDSTVWGGYWPASGTIEVWEGTFSDPEELRKTLRHEARHAQVGSSESEATAAETQCPPPA